MPPESIETLRLILRSPHLADAPAIFEQYAQDSLVARYLAWRPHQNLAEIEAILQVRIAEWLLGERWSEVVGQRRF